MKIVIIGSNGTIGSGVVKFLKNFKLYNNLEIIEANSKDLDISDVESIKKFFNKIGKFDHLIATTGSVAFKTLADSQTQDWDLSLNNKLMGQINLVKYGVPYLTNNQGSFTLTSGIIVDQAIKTGLLASTVNGALHAFVKTASYELRTQARINVVSPAPLLESWEGYQSYFPGFIPVSAKEVASHYAKAIFGITSGEVFKVGY